MENEKKITRYMSGYVHYKNATCRLSEYDIAIINDYCRRNNISRSMFLASAAVYCAQNKIDRETLLDQTIGKIDYEKMKAEEYEYDQDIPEM